jgi:hypothetical protein
MKPRTIRWEVHPRLQGQKRNAYRVLLGKYGGKKLLEKSWVLCGKCDIKIDFKEI